MQQLGELTYPFLALLRDLMCAAQLNIAFPPNGTQKKLDVDDDGKL